MGTGCWLFLSDDYDSLQQWGWENLFIKKGSKIDKELAEAMEQQMRSFKEKFGREMGPDDPIFFDPDCDIPMPLTEAKLKNELIEAVGDLANWPENDIRGYPLIGVWTHLCPSHP